MFSSQGGPAATAGGATGYIAGVSPVPATPRRAGLPAVGFVIPVVAAIAAVFVFRGALAYFFSQDDFLGLARASGLAPRLTGVWRYLSHQAFFDVMRPMAGLDAAPYHAVSLAAHAACAALLAVFLGRLVSRPAALIGAVFFAVHPSLYGAVYWISAVGDSVALLGALAALLLALRRDRLRWASLPVFGLSLLAKESTLPLPVVVALVAPMVRPAPAATRGVALGLTTVALVYLVTFVAGNAFGVRGGAVADGPYAVGLGTHIGANALSYLGWAANFFLPTMLGFKDDIDAQVFPWAIGILVLWLLGLGWRRLRERGWYTGGAVFVLFLLPVLALRHHTYHYYLYAPLVGVAWCIAAAAEQALSRFREDRVPWAIAGACVVLLTLNGRLMVHKIETMPLVLGDLRADPIVDRARIARNVQESLAAVPLPPGDSLLFWSPIASSLGPAGESLAGPTPRETYWESNVRTALLDGLAVRVMFPQVARVRFVREFQPAPAGTWYALYRPEGRVRVITPAKVDSILRGRRAAP